ncbi:unnamed protein product [Boreogadus saida]
MRTPPEESAYARERVKAKVPFPQFLLHHGRDNPHYETLMWKYQRVGEPDTVLKGHASGFRDDMEELVHGDLEVLEQQRLQDVLLSAPVTPDDDLHAQWERRLPALLDRRERHLQRMSSLLEGLERSLGSVPRSMAAQLGDTGRFLQALRDACSHAPLDLRTVEDLLTAELERSSTAAQLSTNTIQVILETQGRVCQELEALKVETTNVLEEERSKTAALLAVDSAALHPGQLQLLRDNQKLLLQLHRSQEQLTESDESFQLFIGRCCTRSVAPLEQTLVDITKVQHLLALPKALVQLYNQILENNSQANQGLRDTMTVLKGHASGFRDDMEELVHGDLEVLEQQRLQDVLLSAPVTPDDDLHAQWERRLPALLDRRERHLQRMSSLLEGLERSLGSVPRSMAAQLGDTGRFLQALRDACSHAPLDLRTVEDLLTAELERSSTAAQLSTNTLQVILETQGRVCQELEALKVETTNVLEEERSKTAALLAVDSAALHPGQLQLLRDNQKLLLQLHRSQEQLTGESAAQAPPTGPELPLAGGAAFPVNRACLSQMQKADLTLEGCFAKVGPLDNIVAGVAWLRQNAGLLRGKVVEPAVRNMDPKEQQELLERIQDTDEEEKYPLLFTFDFQEDMEEVFHNMAAEEDLRVNAMFLGRWVDSQ